MQDQDFPFGLALFKLLLEPLALGLQVEELAVTVKDK